MVIQYSTGIEKKGLLNDFLDQHVLVPLAKESTDMTYSAAEMSKSLGDLQNMIRMKNLIENYIMILLFVFTMIAVISLTNASKFVLRKTQSISHSKIDDYFVEFIERAEDKEECEERMKSKADEK